MNIDDSINVGYNCTNININLKEVNLKGSSKYEYIQGLKFSPKYKEFGFRS